MIRREPAVDTATITAVTSTPNETAIDFPEQKNDETKRKRETRREPAATEDAKTLSKLLAKIHSEGEKYGIRLNKDKCEHRILLKI